MWSGPGGKEMRTFNWNGCTWQKQLSEWVQCNSRGLGRGEHKRQAGKQAQETIGLLTDYMILSGCFQGEANHVDLVRWATWSHMWSWLASHAVLARHLVPILDFTCISALSPSFLPAALLDVNVNEAGLWLHQADQDQGVLCHLWHWCQDAL